MRVLGYNNARQVAHVTVREDTSMLPILLTLSLSAPVPQHKPKSRPPLTQHGWKMVWNNHSWPDTRFCADGHYASGTAWEGRWTLQGDTLTITERWKLADHPTDSVYVIQLEPGKWEGKIASAASPNHPVAFKLER